MKRLSITFLICLILSQCSSSGSSAPADRLLVFSLGDNLLPEFSLNDDLEQDILSNESYQYQLSVFSKNQIVWGPAAVEEYNAERNLYNVHANLKAGDYRLVYQLIKINNSEDPQRLEVSSDPLILSSVEVEIRLDETITDIDLSTQSWSHDFDQDEDGLSNLEELNGSTDPFNADSDGDGTIDGEDAFPNDASESLDSDHDGWGDSSDNCPESANPSQDDQDQDSLGDACDSDADNDDHHDEQDNCPNMANPGQEDLDLNGVGDVCDTDIDGDGLSNDEEELLATNSYLADTDGDGISDSKDVFPLDASESLDSDQDGVGDQKDNCHLVANADQKDLNSNGTGDACDNDDDSDGVLDIDDNCPQTLAEKSLVADAADQTDTDMDGYGAACDCHDSDESFYPGAVDSPDHLVQDKNCDGLDGDRSKAIFATTDHDLQEALNQAFDLGYDLYLSTGVHNVTDLQLKDGVSIYGGFDSDFTTRVHSIEGAVTQLNVNRSELPSSLDWATGLKIDSFETPIEWLSLVIQSQMNHTREISLSINQSDVTLKNIKLLGNSLADHEILLKTQSSSISITSSWIEAFASSSAIGFQAIESLGQIDNSIVIAGSAANTVGLDFQNSDLNVIQNTINGGQHAAGTAFGLTIYESIPTLINNIFISENDNLQASIRCLGELPALPMGMQNNIFLRYTSKALTYPAYISCDAAESYLSTDSQVDDFSDEITANNNQFDNLSNDSLELSNLLSADYELIETTTSHLTGQGQDTSSYGVTTDYYGALRTDPYNLGAKD